MGLIQWDDIMSVRVETIDKQHKRLIELINQAYEAIQKQDSRMMTELLDQMSEYANRHFTDEEALMKQCGYPDLERHKALHHKFIVDVEDFRKKQYEKTNFSKLFVYLSRWLTTHIMDEDKKYSPFMPPQRTES